jgi:hypothetical protein
VIAHGSHRHRTYNAVAGCRWPRAEWVEGQGPFALLAYCDVLTVMLHPSRELAEDSRRWIDHYGCGHACRVARWGDPRAHRIIDLRDGGGGQR